MKKNKKLLIIFAAVAAITVLIIVNSVVFSVQHVNAYSIKGSYPDLDKAIEENHGIRIGSSIFVLNEQKASARLKQNLLDKGIANVDILYFERKFPNRVAVTYERLYEYFYVPHAGQAYLFACKNGTLLSSAPLSSVPAIAELRLQGTLQSTQLAAKFASSVASDAEKVDSFLYALAHLTEPYQTYKSAITFIDIASANTLFLGTEKGVVIEIALGTDLPERLNMGFSTYHALIVNAERNPAYPAMLESGTIVVSNASIANYTTQNRYAER
ncbi:MAG: hypothetical protein FWH03_04900 [Firmicutes bacterium]|nr:hypothetical protein [Bacillota bacterium]